MVQSFTIVKDNSVFRNLQPWNPQPRNPEPASAQLCTSPVHSPRSSRSPWRARRWLGSGPADASRLCDGPALPCLPARARPRLCCGPAADEAPAGAGWLAARRGPWAGKATEPHGPSCSDALTTPSTPPDRRLPRAVLLLASAATTAHSHHACARVMRHLRAQRRPSPSPPPPSAPPSPPPPPSPSPPPPRSPPSPPPPSPPPRLTTAPSGCGPRRSPDARGNGIGGGGGMGGCCGCCGGSCLGSAP